MMGDSTFPMQAQNALMSAKTTSIPGKGIVGKGVPGTKIPGRSMKVENARRVSQDFEAFFLSQMLKPMFSGIKAEEPFGGGPAEEMWRTLQVDEYGKAIARSGGIGIADTVLKEMIKLQEGS